ncbi:MAG TPA: serine--tRNA ligase, partial [Alkalispirochaeta sp.]|nr:serine--tRNA ligase [Alkalispirochaeta sp.]
EYDEVMLDLKYVREHPEILRENIANRHVTADLDAVLTLYDKRNELLQTVEEQRARRNENARAMKQKLADQERAELIEEGKRLKHEIGEREAQLRRVEEQLTEAAETLPNYTHPDTPIGATDESNRELEIVGSVPQFDFEPRDHVALGELLDIVDFEHAAKVSGAKFYYLRNQGVFLELALIRFAMDFLSNRGFTPMITPDIARTDVVAGIGFNPRGPESNIYNLDGEDSSLVGTAEITLGGYYSGESLDGSQLPLRMAGLSHCFRREAGAAGQFSRGLYRVHQFTKVEMFVLAHPEESEQIHQEMLNLERELFSTLEIPFRVVDVCTGDLGNPAYRKFDLEAWMPGRGEHGEWGEITSTSNCTDFQSRRLNIRYSKTDASNKKEKGYVHLLNGTAVAVSRAIIAILENHQQKDGSVTIPSALRPYTGFERINPA